MDIYGRITRIKSTSENSKYNLYFLKIQMLTFNSQELKTPILNRNATRCDRLKLNRAEGEFIFVPDLKANVGSE